MGLWRPSLGTQPIPTKPISLPRRLACAVTPRQQAGARDPPGTQGGSEAQARRPELRSSARLGGVALTAALQHWLARRPLVVDIGNATSALQVARLGFGVLLVLRRGETH